MTWLMTLVLGFVLGWFVHSVADRASTTRFEPVDLDPEDAEAAARMYGCVKIVVPIFVVAFLGLMLVGSLLSSLSNGAGLALPNPFSAASAQQTNVPSPIQTQPSVNTTTVQPQPVVEQPVTTAPEQSAETNNVLSVQMTTAEGTTVVTTAPQTGAAELDQAIAALDTAQSDAPADGQQVAQANVVEQGSVSAESQPPPQPEPTAIPQAVVPPPVQRPVIDTNGVATFTGTDLTIVGTAPPESVILVMLNGTLYGNAKTDAEGRWLVAGQVTPANYEIYAYVMSATGLIPSEPVYLNVTQ